jgi:hypothetical protein
MFVMFITDDSTIIGDDISSDDLPRFSTINSNALASVTKQQRRPSPRDPIMHDRIISDEKHQRRHDP